MFSEEKEKKNRVTKEVALAITPIAAAYLFIAFYEAGFCSFYGIPHDLIDINITDVFLTNRYTLIVAVIAFLWIGLYYNLLPSANSPIFKLIITFILIGALSLGFMFGSNDARSKKDYLVVSGSPEMAVVKIYGDNIIMAQFNRGSKTLEKNFMINKVGQTSDKYRLEHIGPLSAP